MKKVARFTAGVVGGWLLGAAFSWAAAPTDVPENLKAPAGEQLILETHAKGVQIYTCQAGSGGPPAWTLKAPDAQLSDSKGKPIIHHFEGPTWMHKDGSAVTGKAAARADSPDKSSVPWLLLTATGHTGSGVLAKVTSVQRLHTQGGQPPATGCDATKIGAETRSAYTADYYFYAPAR